VVRWKQKSWRSIFKSCRASDAEAPSVAQVAKVNERVLAAIADIRKNPGDLTSRLNNSEAKVHRAASIEVRRRMAEQWNA
jgi:malonate decarboxylase gamma subunit